MLEEFQDIEELHKIIVFQTGHSTKTIGDKIDMSDPHLRKLLGDIKRNKVSDKVKKDLLADLKKAYEKEIMQFVRKYSKVHVSSSEPEQRLKVIAKTQAAMMDVVLALASEKKAVYNKSVEILKKHGLESIFL